MSTRSKILIGIVAALVVLSAATVFGLYMALNKVSGYEPAPPEKQAVKEPAPIPQPVQIEMPRPVAVTPPLPKPTQVEKKPAVPSVAPVAQTPPFAYSPRQDPQRKAFRDARRAIKRQGQEPDWNQFEGRDLDKLKNIWEKEQKQGPKKEAQKKEQRLQRRANRQPIR